MTTDLIPPAMPDNFVLKHQLAETFLEKKYPFLLLVRSASILNEESKKNYEKVRLEMRPERLLLLALSITELQNKLSEQKRKSDEKLESLAKEAAVRRTEKAEQIKAKKFYNLPNANADFEYWSKAEFWTFEEALALLLGKDPTVVTRAAVKREITAESGLFFTSENYKPTAEFLCAYERLRTLAERAKVMMGPHLVPTEVVEWALKAAIVQPPEELTRLLAASLQGLHVTDFSQAENPQVATNSSELLEEAPEFGSPVRWTQAKLNELGAYREKFGTKAAAVHFGISTGWIRQLLPKEKEASKAAGYSAFNPRL